MSTHRITRKQVTKSQSTARRILKWFTKTRQSYRETKRIKALNEVVCGLQESLDVADIAIKERDSRIDELEKLGEVQKSQMEFLWTSLEERNKYVESLNTVHGFKAGQ